MYTSTARRCLRSNRVQRPEGRCGPFVAPQWAAARLGRRVFPSKEHYVHQVLSDFDGSGRHHPRRRGLGAVSVSRHTAMGEVSMLTSGFGHEPVSLGKRRYVPDVFPELNAVVNPTFKRFTEEHRQRHASETNIFSIHDAPSINLEPATRICVKERRARRNLCQLNNSTPVRITRIKCDDHVESLDTHTVTYGHPRKTYLHSHLKPYNSNRSHLYSRIKALSVTSEKPAAEYMPSPTREEFVAAAEDDFYGLTQQEEAFIDNVCDRLDARRRAAAMEVEAVSYPFSAPAPMHAEVLLEDTEVLDYRHNMSPVADSASGNTLIDGNDDSETRLEPALHGIFHNASDEFRDSAPWLNFEWNAPQAPISPFSTNAISYEDYVNDGVQPSALLPSMIEDFYYDAPLSVPLMFGQETFAHTPSPHGHTFGVLVDPQTLALLEGCEDNALYAAPQLPLDMFDDNAGSIMDSGDTASHIPSIDVPRLSLLPTVDDANAMFEAVNPPDSLVATPAEVDAFLATVPVPSQEIPSTEPAAHAVEREDGEPDTEADDEHNERDVHQARMFPVVIEAEAVIKGETQNTDVEVDEEFVVDDSPANGQAPKQGVDDTKSNDPEPHTLQALGTVTTSSDLEKDDVDIAAAFDLLRLDAPSLLPSIPVLNVVPTLTSAEIIRGVPSVEVLETGRSRESSGPARTKHSSHRVNPLSRREVGLTEWRDTTDQGHTSLTSRRELQKRIKANEKKAKEKEAKERKVREKEAKEREAKEQDAEETKNEDTENKTGIKWTFNPFGRTLKDMLKVSPPEPDSANDLVNSLIRVRLASPGDMGDPASASSGISTPSSG